MSLIPHITFISFHITLILYFAMSLVKLSHIYLRKTLHLQTQGITLLWTLVRKHH